MTKLEQYDYAGATAIAPSCWSSSFVLLLVINLLQALGPRDRMARRPLRWRRPPARCESSALPSGASCRAARAALVRFAADRGQPRASSALFCSCRWSPSSRGVRQGRRRLPRRAARPDTRAAIRLTLARPRRSRCRSTLVFGLAAAWAIAKFGFRGKSLLITLIDLPFAVSPVIAGPDLRAAVRRAGLVRAVAPAHDIQIIFAVPGHRAGDAVRHLPVRRARADPADAGAGHRRGGGGAASWAPSGWQTFFRVTLPNVKWALLYGVILCNARAMGEFGAVSVVSGHIRGLTNTMPLHVEILYNEYNFVGAFAVASLLTLLGAGDAGGEDADRVAHRRGRRVGRWRRSER